MWCDNPGMSANVCIWLSPEDRAELEGWVADRNTPQKLVWRSRIVGTMSIMRTVGKSKPSVWRWQARYLAQGIAGLKRDATRPGRKPALTPEVIARVVEKTLHEKPQAATHWSTRTMAQAVGLGHTSVRRIWHAHGLKPHLTRGFKLSNDKRFVEKVQDVVGLYLCPPDRALVLSVDEKSQGQALDRTQPGLGPEITEATVRVLQAAAGRSTFSSSFPRDPHRYRLVATARAGFASIRSFNASFREVYRCTPSELRGRAQQSPPPRDGEPLYEIGSRPDTQSKLL